MRKDAVLLERRKQLIPEIGISVDKVSACTVCFVINIKQCDRVAFRLTEIIRKDTPGMIRQQGDLKSPGLLSYVPGATFLQ